MMTDEIPIKEEIKKEKFGDKFKKYLPKQINFKIKVALFILLFIMFNYFMKWITYQQASFNVFLILIAIVIISAIDGFFKHKEVKE